MSERRWKYPPPAKGGRYYMEFLERAIQYGWERASAGLERERRNRRGWEQAS